MKKYINIVYGRDENSVEPLPLSMSIVGDVLFYALNDGCSELSFTKDEYDCLKRYMAYNGQWNWDMKTFMGMKIIIL